MIQVANNLPLYFLLSNLYLLLFYSIYQIWLRKDTFLSRNRWYLLSAGLLSLLLPAISLLPFAQSEIAAPIISNVENTEALELVRRWNNPKGSILDSTNIWIALYALVTAIFVLRLIWAVFAIAKLAIKQGIRPENGVWTVPLPSNQAPFSFFFLLFWSEQPEWSAEEKQQVWAHELAHIRQAHSFDIIFFELLGAIFWVNPICLAYQRSIREVHEYLADASATRQSTSKTAYASLLLGQFLGAPSVYLSNHFLNKTFLKRRIMMLNQPKSNPLARHKWLLLFPVLLIGLMVQACSEQFLSNSNVEQVGPKKVQKKINGRDRFLDNFTTLKEYSLDDYAGQEIIIDTREIDMHAVMINIVGPDEKPAEGYTVCMFKSSGEMCAANVYEGRYFDNFSYRCREQGTYTLKVERKGEPKGSIVAVRYQKNQ